MCLRQFCFHCCELSWSSTHCCLYHVISLRPSPVTILSLPLLIGVLPPLFWSFSRDTFYHQAIYLYPIPKRTVYLHHLPSFLPPSFSHTCMASYSARFLTHYFSISLLHCTLAFITIFPSLCIFSTFYLAHHFSSPPVTKLSPLSPSFPLSSYFHGRGWSEYSFPGWLDVLPFCAPPDYVNTVHGPLAPRP